MKKNPLYFIAVRHPEAYESPEDGDGRLTKMGKEQAGALKQFVFGLREKLAKDSSKTSTFQAPISAFSSLLQRSFKAAVSVACSRWSGNVVTLRSLDETNPGDEKARKAFGNIMEYYHGEEIIIIVCHGSMAGMLIREAYEHFVFPINSDEMPEDIGSDTYYACGYMLDLANNSIGKIDVGREIAEMYTKK